MDLAKTNDFFSPRVADSDTFRLCFIQHHVLPFLAKQFKHCQVKYGIIPDYAQTVINRN